MSTADGRAAHTHGPMAGPYSGCPACAPALRPLDPRQQHHAYGGVEHRSEPPVEGCLLCKLEAVAAAWFSFDQQALDALLHEYRSDDDV